MSTSSLSEMSDKAYDANDVNVQNWEEFQSLLQIVSEKKKKKETLKQKQKMKKKKGPAVPAKPKRKGTKGRVPQPSPPRQYGDSDDDVYGGGDGGTPLTPTSNLTASSGRVRRSQSLINPHADRPRSRASSRAQYGRVNRRESQDDSNIPPTSYEEANGSESGTRVSRTFSREDIWRTLLEKHDAYPYDSEDEIESDSDLWSQDHNHSRTQVLDDSYIRNSISSRGHSSSLLRKQDSGFSIGDNNVALANLRENKLRAICLFDFEGENLTHLSFKRNDMLVLLEEHLPSDHMSWVKGERNGCVGFVPFNFLRVLEDGEEPQGADAYLENNNDEGNVSSARMSPENITHKRFDSEVSSSSSSRSEWEDEKQNGGTPADTSTSPHDAPPDLPTSIDRTPSGRVLSKLLEAKSVGSRLELPELDLGDDTGSDIEIDHENGSETVDSDGSYGFINETISPRPTEPAPPIPVEDEEEEGEGEAVRAKVAEKETEKEVEEEEGGEATETGADDEKTEADLTRLYIARMQQARERAEKARKRRIERENGSLTLSQSGSSALDSPRSPASSSTAHSPRESHLRRARSMKKMAKAERMAAVVLERDDMTEEEMMKILKEETDSCASSESNLRRSPTNSDYFPPPPEEDEESGGVRERGSGGRRKKRDKDKRSSGSRSSSSFTSFTERKGLDIVISGSSSRGFLSPTHSRDSLIKTEARYDSMDHIPRLPSSSPSEYSAYSAVTPRSMTPRTPRDDTDLFVDLPPLPHSLVGHVRRILHGSLMPANDDDTPRTSARVKDRNEPRVTGMVLDAWTAAYIPAMGEWAEENYKENAKKESLEKRRSFQTKLIKRPLCDVVKSKQDKKLALKAFRSVTGYMNDRSSSKAPMQHAVGLLARSIEASDEVRDEVYCQILKQITNHPKQENFQRGLSLLSLCCSVFPPSINLLPYVVGYLKQIFEAERKITNSQTALAKWCLERLSDTCEAGIRHHPPREHEITAIESRAKMLYDIYIQGRKESIKAGILPQTTVRDVVDIVCKKLDVETIQCGRFHCIGLYLVARDSSGLYPDVERGLGEGQRFMDALCSWSSLTVELGKQYKNAKYTFNVTLHPRYILSSHLVDMENLSEAALSLYYDETVHHVIKGTYRVSLETAVVLGGLQLYSDLYDNDELNPNKLEALCYQSWDKYFPDPMMANKRKGAKAHSIEQQRKVISKDISANALEVWMQGRTKKEIMHRYLRVVRRENIEYYVSPISVMYEGYIHPRTGKKSLKKPTPAGVCVTETSIMIWKMGKKGTLPLSPSASSLSLSSLSYPSKDSATLIDQFPVCAVTNIQSSFDGVKISAIVPRGGETDTLTYTFSVQGLLSRALVDLVEGYQDSPSQGMWWCSSSSSSSSCVSLLFHSSSSRCSLCVLSLYLSLLSGHSNPLSLSLILSRFPLYCVSLIFAAILTRSPSLLLYPTTH